MRVKYKSTSSSTLNVWISQTSKSSVLDSEQRGIECSSADMVRDGGSLARSFSGGCDDCCEPETVKVVLTVVSRRQMLQYIFELVPRCIEICTVELLEIYLAFRTLWVYGDAC